MDADLLQRIRRIYAAVAATEKTDPKKLRATVIKTDEFMAMLQDFRSGLSDEELSDHAHSVIHNIANLRDHLRRWAAHNGKDKDMVDDTLRQSPELQIIIDLSNNDKHGYPPRDRGQSGRYPKLVEITRVMQLATRAEAGATSAMTLGSDDTPRFLRDGTAKAVVTGDTVDKNDNRISDLHEIATKAVEAWERLLSKFGVTTGTDAT
ncbi:MAG: hypothetical protein JSU63_21000 [Phycisphaerales bacterium]|nr:MAG: hypothetical protein JSU63_21000 [Phycisphaerales bacterium]